MNGEPVELPSNISIPSGGAVPTAKPPIQGMARARQAFRLTGLRTESVVRSRYGALTASRSRMDFNVNALSRTGGALFDAAGGDNDPQQDDFERLGH